MDAGFIVSLLTLGLCALFFLYCKAYLRRRTGQERILAEFKEEVRKMIADIDAATDRDATLIEDRVKTLKTILNDADKRINLLNQELIRRRADVETYLELGHKAKTRLPVLDALDTEDSFYEKNEKSDKNEEKNASSFIKNEKKDEPPPEIESMEKHKENKRERIAELAKAGFSPRIIAARLGMSESEVEIAIAIAEQRS
jgi:hypothetical protein